MFLAATALWPLSNNPGSQLGPHLFNAQTGEEGLFQSCNLLLTFSILFQNVLNPAVTRAPSPRHHWQ